MQPPRTRPRPVATAGHQPGRAATHSRHPRFPTPYHRTPLGSPPLPAHRGTCHTLAQHPTPHPHIFLTHSWSGVRIPLRAPSHNHLPINGLCRRKPARNTPFSALTTARDDKLVTNYLRLRSNEALWEKGRRPQGTPSKPTGAAACFHPTPSLSAPGPGFAAGSPVPKVATKAFLARKSALFSG